MYMIFVLVGSFVDGVEHGSGTLTSVSSGETFKGEWQHGERCGHGVLEYGDDHPKGREQYLGAFKDELPHGKGKLTFTNGDVYEVRYRCSNTEDCARGVPCFPHSSLCPSETVPERKRYFVLERSCLAFRMLFYATHNNVAQAL